VSIGRVLEAAARAERAKEAHGDVVFDFQLVVELTELGRFAVPWYHD
jgi:hypothetical protein